MAEGDTFVNALVGGVAAIVFSFVPFSPVLGGGLAGYLQGGTSNDGLRVGAYAGAVAAVPLALVSLLVLFLFGFGIFLGGTRAGGVLVIVLFMMAFIVATALYTVGLGALGGWLGNYVKYETDIGDDQGRAQ